MPVELLSQQDDIVLRCGDQLLRLRFTTPSSVRVTCTRGREAFLDKPSLIVTHAGRFAGWTFAATPAHFEFRAPGLRVKVAKESGALSYEDGEGKALFREPARGGRWLTPRTLQRTVFDHATQALAGQNVDGARAVISGHRSVPDREAFEAKLEFEFSEGEGLFGLGSHEEGIGNLRGCARELYQQNMKAVVPMLVSTRGWGLLLDCCSLMTFHDDELGSYWWADAVDELDFHVIAGGSHAEVLKGYHVLTGRPAMLPRWAFGFAQSKERYVNAEELIEVVREHRRRGIPLDLIVLDWKSWPNGSGWGQKSFDPVRFPDPAGMCEALHALGARLMVSIWPIMTGDCENQRELLARGQMLGNQSTYDAFNPEARATYWEQARRGLFAQGVDAWWCDCTEPFEADWTGAVKPEPHRRLALNTAQSKLHIDETLINAYSLLHSQGIYEGQRRAAPERRVVNLTRSSYAGQHRYGTITWNGDICATWETLRRCIPEGLNFCATGEPFWTVDIGGFFINHDRNYWFWRGDYAEGCRGLTPMEALGPDPADTGCRDLGFHELYTRWLQYAVFLPMFRSHGTDAAREAWRFGESGNPFHDAIVAHIRLRYQLIHYIYSAAHEATAAGMPMISPLGLAFPDDLRAHSIDDQFLCGRSLLVCPVTKPMYYEAGSRPLTGVARTRSVYLPQGSAWCDYHTGALHAGGSTIEVEAPLERIPLFVRAGSILPLAPLAQTTQAAAEGPVTLHIYPGADGHATWYEDAGEGSDHESGSFALTHLYWNDATATLRIGPREGTYAGMPSTRKLTLCLHTPTGQSQAQLEYTGEEVDFGWGSGY